MATLRVTKVHRGWKYRPEQASAMTKKLAIFGARESARQASLTDGDQTVIIETAKGEIAHIATYRNGMYYVPTGGVSDAEV